MKNLTDALAWIFLCLMSIVTLSGCTNKTTVDTGALYLQAQAQQVQINSYREQLKRAKSKLTQVIPEVQGNSHTVPKSHLAGLTAFLVQNDCTTFPSNIKDQCYKLTRVKLMEVTRLLDETLVKEYAGQQTIAQLIDNINVLIDSMAEPPPTFGLE